MVEEKQLQVGEMIVSRHQHCPRMEEKEVRLLEAVSFGNRQGFCDQ